MTEFLETANTQIHASISLRWFAVWHHPAARPGATAVRQLPAARGHEQGGGGGGRSPCASLRGCDVLHHVQQGEVRVCMCVCVCCCIIANGNGWGVFIAQLYVVLPTCSNY